ncbi:hypothetical protein INR49_008022 [Caranx melampygus]|nr:hypothetical protein INR49_008022 [Caranx melampygus]
MALAFSLVSLTVSKILQLSGRGNNRNELRSRKMEEKALEVYARARGAAELLSAESRNDSDANT